RDLEDALRPDDDVAQREPVVRKGREQLRIEPPRAVVALPALARRDDLVDARRTQRREQPIDVAAVLGDRVADPEPLDPAQLGRVEPAAEPLLDRGPRKRS